MEHFLKKVIRNYYAAKHEEAKSISFDECFPGEGEESNSRTRFTFPAGLAACLVLAIAMSVFYQRFAIPGSAEGVESVSVMASLHQDIQGSVVLGLSDVQATALLEELEKFIRSQSSGEMGNLEMMKLELLGTLLESRKLELSNSQAVAMTGLMGRWYPRMKDGAISEYVWMDDSELNQFVADCSTQCHTTADFDSLDDAELTNYLLNCLGSWSGTNCNQSGVIEINGHRILHAPGVDSGVDVNI